MDDATRRISLVEDKPAVEQNLLFAYLPELEAYQVNVTDHHIHDPDSLKHLELLIESVKNHYKSISERLDALLADGKITYDLLWALFQPNTHVYTTCPGTGKPRCVKYDLGQEKKTSQGVKYFELKSRYLDFDGKVFGEATEKLDIEKFRGARRIDSLKVFPLKYHPDKESMEQQLITCGEKFVSMLGSHHFQYIGNAFFQSKGDLIRIPVNCRIMIDAGLFRKSNPNYPRLQTKETRTSLDYLFIVGEVVHDRIKSRDVKVTKMKNDDLLICCPTLLGFSLGDKFWGEFAVADISEISWSSLPFDCLTIPSEKKDVIMALAEDRMNRAAAAHFDDFVEGKGRGLRQNGKKVWDNSISHSLVVEVLGFPAPAATEIPLHVHYARQNA